MAETDKQQGNAGRSVQSDLTLGTTRTNQASVIGQVGVPIYDGGLAASQTRPAKEFAYQSRTVLEEIREEANVAAASAWVTNEGTKIALSAADYEVKAYLSI